MPVNVIYGTADHDLLEGTAGLDLILANAGSDEVITHGGKDTVHGEGGNDTLFGLGGGNLLFGGSGDDLIMSMTSSALAPGYLYGGTGNDRIFASDVTNYAYGGMGDDEVSIVLHLGGEAKGGTGIDTLVMTLVAIPADGLAETTGISVILRGADAGATWGTAFMALGGFERLYITTHSGDDTIFGGNFDDRIDVWSGANVVRANGGNDLVSYRTGMTNALNGGAGLDTLQVYEVSDARALSFTVNGNVATDAHGSVIRNFEQFSIIGGAQGDVILVGDGADAFRGLGGNDQGMGMGGDDSLWGGAGDDSLYGGEGSDLLNGGAGHDSLFGCMGADTFLFEYARDTGAFIGDMTAGEDHIAIEARVIGNLLARGVVDAADFHLDTALGTTGQFIYRATGSTQVKELIWDSNGTEAGGELRIALLDHLPDLTAADIVIW